MILFFMTTEESNIYKRKIVLSQKQEAQNGNILSPDEMNYIKELLNLKSNFAYI